MDRISKFYRKNRFLFWLLLGALVFRLVILILTDPLPAFNFLDENAYNQYGWQMAESWHSGSSFSIAKEISHIHVGYFYFVAPIFYLFGYHPFLVKLANILVGLTGVFFLYLLTKGLFSERAARIAAALAAFWPSMALWSTRNLKDAFILMLLALISWLFVKIIRHFSWKILILFLFFSVVLLSIRSYAFFILMGSMAIGFLVSSFQKARRQAILMCVLILVVLGGSILFLYQFKDLQWNYLTKINLPTFYAMHKAGLTGGSVYGVEYNSIMDVIKFFPVGLTYTVLAPFPWQKGSALFKMAIPETILWYLILPALIMGIFQAVKRKKMESWALIIFMILMTATYAILQDNLGSLFRQRAQIWFLGFVFAGAGFAMILDSKNLVLKRFLDIILVGIALVILSPFLLLTAILIMIEDGRPIFFISLRAGQGGRPFGMVKFRSMKKKRVNYFEYSKEDETKVGGWLRRFSVDELPQLFNILKGDMSFVGPRPIFTFLAEKNPDLWKKRLGVKPGLTGWQQVNGRNSLTPDESLRFDEWYVDNRSLGLDLKIIFSTFTVVFTGRGLLASPVLYQRVAKEWESYNR